MRYAIFYRINGGKLQVVTDDDGQPREFPDRDEAILYTEETTLPPGQLVDWQIVELNEL